MEEEKRWYRLDNAAKIFPVTRKAKWSNNFRVSVTLNCKIQDDLLQCALNNTLPRFPNFSLIMKKGLFWYYLEQKSGVPNVEYDVANPCKRFNSKENGGFLFRVRYFERRIAVEVFHVITDGTGAMLFLKTLAAEYLKLLGICIPNECGVYDINEIPKEEEMEDGYKRYAQFKVKRRRKEQKAYHMQGTELPPQMINITTGLMPVDKLIEKAKQYNVTITEFLTSVLIRALVIKQEQENLTKKKPVKVCLPVNLRNFYPSKTLRNFLLFLNVGVEPIYGHFTFEEIIHEVHHFMKLNLSEKYLNAVMSLNLSGEMNPVLKGTPLFVKNFGMQIAYMMYGDSLNTCTLSNLGKITVPAEMEVYIERFDFMFGRSRKNHLNAAVVSFGKTLNLTFASKIVESDVEREFFTYLVKMGVPVKIESNK